MDSRFSWVRCVLSFYVLALCYVNRNGFLMGYIGLNGNGYLIGIWVMNKGYLSLNGL